MKRSMYLVLGLLLGPGRARAEEPVEKPPVVEKPSRADVEAAETRNPESLKKDPAALPEEDDRAPLDGRELLIRIHHMNQVETKLGAHVAAHAESPDVRSYAAHLAADHQAEDLRVKVLAKRKKVSLAEPTPFTDEERAAMEQAKAERAMLETLTGAALDRAYLRTMIAAHDRDLAMLRRSAEIISDGDVAALVRRLIPSVRAHRDQADALRAALEPRG